MFLSRAIFVAGWSQRSAFIGICSAKIAEEKRCRLGLTPPATGLKEGPATYVEAARFWGERHAPTS